jgi:NADH-quinone oxidoreductase subunit L
MFKLLFLAVLIPFLSSAKLMVIGRRLSRLGIALTGVGSIALSAVIALIIGINFMISPPPGNSYTQTLWTWLSVDGLSSGITFYMDPLSVVMMLVITVVGFLIHLYSAQFMIEEEGYSRFFAYMNLFVGSMLVLVLAENLLLLYLGWEGVGLCSYLLIGFWYRTPANGRAAMKAFIVTRIGDAALAVGIFLLFYAFGTLGIQEILQRASNEWISGTGIAIAAAALLLGGAVGKSAQLPLQVWLPDAMAGPTPVSALIHAATMVTAGVYLIARTHTLFTAAPPIQTAVAVIGAATLLLASFSALTQYDIKRVLAYSTISQIGYMFVALGVGAWSAAIFHFMIHAFFKALLFLCAGVLILGTGGEHDIYKMGGLRRQLPLTFWTFLIGAASLSALPLITAGYFSKDQILWHAFSSSKGSFWLWGAGLFGAFLTSMYTFRIFFLAFFGEEKMKVKKLPGLPIKIPLVTLAVFSIIAGYVEFPWSNYHPFSAFLRSSFPGIEAVASGTGIQSTIRTTTTIVSLTGILLAYVFFLKSPQGVRSFIGRPIGTALRCFLLAGWNFDLVYDKFIVKPFVWVARINRRDTVDLIYKGIAFLHKGAHLILSASQNGKVRWYATGIAIGAVIIIAVTVVIL